ncbi:hypothetical protein CP532_3729 [Ophiocordyceps camponoti-leonardi (nom. inval.)]|nr:hypothetical protein CP532_3729 [Ophiocordyceps camponoti-leonardi (nom. inval.)]
MAAPPPLAPHPRRTSSEHLLPIPAGSDPRSRSTQSLVPDSEPYDGPRRRLLLLVYIHGFYGNAQSFRSFPAHVHALLRRLLADSHVVHTKIYPRYKTYRAIDVARDNLSAWLEPHESPDTDVVLVGHSMGGLLAAEVALMRVDPPKPGRHADTFKHRILGTLSLDSPFLGLHPRIVAAGISSLFHPAENAEAEAEPPPAPPETDPCFDPPYWNDEPLKEQPFLSRVMHFTSKHKSDGFFNALRNHVASHLEFGGCLADYPGLISRYDRLRALEDVDEIRDGSARVRFVNYYTLCSGRPKGPKHDPEVDAGLSDVSETALAHGVGAAADDGDGQDVTVEEQQASQKSPAPQDTEPAAALVLTTPPPSSSTKSRGSSAEGSGDEDDGLNELDDADVTPVPDEPIKPEPPDLQQFSEGAARKKAEKDAKRAQRSYEEAVKDRAKAIRRRDKLLEQRRKEAKRETEKQQREAQKATQRQEKEAREAEKKEKKKEEARRQRQRREADSTDATTPPPRGSRKFCALPSGRLASASASASASSFDGDGDPTWIDVYLEGVDEVGAHCGLFVASAPHYDALVGDVGSRIAEWVNEYLSARAVLGGDLT